MFRNIIVLLFILSFIGIQSTAQQIVPNTRNLPMHFKIITVKKTSNGKICDSCKADFAFDAMPEFSYLITGSQHTPYRLSLHKSDPQYVTNSPNTSRYLFSTGHVGITFLPNYLLENGKRIQIWRDWGGPVYNELEFQVRQNNSIINNWTPLISLKENKEYKIFGALNDSTNASYLPWKRTFHAGNFDMAVNDSLYVTVRNIETKKVIKTIVIFRPVDKATNFYYYQIPLSKAQFGVNLQNILNLNTNTFKNYSGDSVRVFEKDYNAIGILRFPELQENEEIEYSFGNKPLNWKSAGTRDPKTGIFLVLPADMQDGEDHEIYLRYKSQLETVYSIIIKVKKRPFHFPWIVLTISFTLILAFGIVLFYLRELRNKRKMRALDKKNTETESHLALLSGQLNPHFLFNTLAAIQGTINGENPDRANYYIGSVAKFMRDVMDHGQKEFVSLKEELKLEEDYLQLEQQRITFKYSITIGAELITLLIDFPPLLLQPILENSIRHAFGNGLSSQSLEINVIQLEKNLIIEVADNGSLQWDTVSASEGHGLSLTRKRIAIYNEKLQYSAISLDIDYVAGKGTITTFTFKNWLA